MKNGKSQKTLQSPNERQRRKDPFQLLPLVREIHINRFRSTERGGEIKMNLRWYQTYDENGVSSEEILQQYNARYEHWENVPFIREREEYQEGRGEDE